MEMKDQITELIGKHEGGLSSRFFSSHLGLGHQSVVVLLNEMVGEKKIRYDFPTDRYVLLNHYPLSEMKCTDNQGRIHCPRCDYKTLPQEGGIVNKNNRGSMKKHLTRAHHMTPRQVIETMSEMGILPSKSKPLEHTIQSYDGKMEKDDKNAIPSKELVDLIPEVEAPKATPDPLPPTAENEPCGECVIGEGCDGVTFTFTGSQVNTGEEKSRWAIIQDALSIFHRCEDELKALGLNAEIKYMVTPDKFYGAVFVTDEKDDPKEAMTMGYTDGED